MAINTPLPVRALAFAAAALVSVCAAAQDVSSSSHPSASYWYIDTTFDAEWPDYEPGAAGFRWLIDGLSDTAVTTGNSAATSNRSLSDGPHAHGTWYFHLAAVDGGGNVLPGTQVDFQFNVLDEAPSVTSSSHPAADPANYERDFTATLSAPAEVTEGSVAGYRALVDESASTAPGVDDTLYDTQPITIAGNAPGEHWFHGAAVDRLGNISAPVHHAFEVLSDAPVISSLTHPTQNEGYPAKDIIFNWDDPAGMPEDLVDRYLYVFDDAPGTIPRASANATEQQNQTIAQVSIGTHYFHVRSQDVYGYLSPTAHYRVIVSQAAAPVVSSSTHPDPTQDYAARDVTFEWTDPDSSSRSYYYVLDKNSDTLPEITDTQVLGRTTTLTDLADGAYWFHVRGRDAYGNLTKTGRFRVNVVDGYIDTGFSADTTAGNAPLTVNFTGTADESPIDSWSWDFGDGETGAGQNPSHVYDAAGRYTVTLETTAGDKIGYVEKTEHITVSDTVAADFTASPTTGQPPLTVEFSDSSDGLLDTWEWDFDDDGAIDATGQNPFYTFEAPGSYDVTLSVSGDDGSDSTTKPGYITVEPYDPPSVNFTGSPTSGERPLTVAFTNATTGQVDSWAWDFDGDGVTDSELELPDPYTYDDVDIYTVTLSAAGPGGSDDLTRTDYITVEGIPAEAAFSATPLEGLAPLEVQFTDESTGDIDYWEWDLDGDSFTDSNEQSPSFTYDEPGTYNVSLLVEGDGGTDTENKANYITVLEPAAADFTATPTEGVAPLAVDFANASSGDIVAYEWDFDGDGAFDSTEENPSHTYANPGLYTVSLRVTGTNGEDTETKTDYIEVYAPAEANFSGAPLEGPAPLTVQFTDASAGDIAAYEWDLDGDGSFDDSTESNPAFTYDTPGQYTVALRVSGDGGTDTETKPDYVTVYEPAEAGFSATPTQGVAPLPVSFTNESTGDIVTYEWDFDGDGAFDSTEESPSHTYGEAGTFTVTLRVSGPGGEDTETKTGLVQVYAPAEADFSAFPLDGAAPLTVQFTDLSDGDVDTYAWDLDGDGENDSALRDPSFVYDTPGVYDVTLSVAGDGGEDTESKPGYITVYAPAVADFAADATEGEAPFTVTFTNNSSGNYTAAEWDFDGDGAIDSTDAGAQLEFTYDTPGQYDVALTVSGPGGTDTLTRPDYIMVNRPPNQPPVAEVAETEIFLTSLGGMALLDGSPSSDPDGDALFYSWREGEGNPCHGLLPPESESLAAVPLHFDTPGQYLFELRVSDGDLMSASTRTVTVLVPGVNGAVDWTPSDGLTPLAGARLAAYGSEADAESGANPLDAAVSDAHGSVSLRHAGPHDQSTGRDYWVVASRLGFPDAAPQRLTVVPDPGAEDALRRFSLPRGSLTSLTGTVFDQADAAIENANLFILPALGAEGFVAWTDAGGGYELTELPLGPWVMQLRGPAGSYMPETRLIGLGSGRGPLDLHLTPSTGPGAVTGRVTAADTGLPIEDATVSLGTGAAAQTSATGTYVIPNAQAGAHALYVTKDGYEPLRYTPVWVAAGQVTQRDAVLRFAHCGHTVSGLIVDGENGDPVRDATVGVVRGGILAARDATDATGFFQLTGVPAGSHDFQVTAPGYEPLSFTESITGSTRLDDTDIVHAPSWQDRMTPQDPLAPRAAVADADIYLQTMSRTATLDASPSEGEGLTYLWHENPGNPATGLVPAGSETAATVVIDGFPRPGVYHFHVRVTDGVRLSPNTAAVTVYVPGLAGHVHAAGSGGYLRIANAQVRAYETYEGAAAWAANGVVDSALSSGDPLGAYALDQLPAGAYWIVAHGPPGSAYETFGPVLRQSGYGAASSHAAVGQHGKRRGGWVVKRPRTAYSARPQRRRSCPR